MKNCLLFTDEADSLSKEENNFIRLDILTKKIATQAVCLLVDNKNQTQKLEQLFLLNYFLSFSFF
jgi:hypothetical protein